MIRILIFSFILMICLVAGAETLRSEEMVGGSPSFNSPGSIGEDLPRIPVHTPEWDDYDEHEPGLQNPVQIQEPRIPPPVTIPKTPIAIPKSPKIKVKPPLSK